MTDLTIAGVTKSYGDTPVLHGVDLHIPAGSLTAILGPSGCGKTTLLRLIAGFDQPDAGVIALGELPLYRDGRSIPSERRRIGYVAQEGALFPHLTIADNIAFGLPRSARKGGGRVAELLDMVGLEAGYARRYPHQLSGGQQQRVALARALAPEPAVILLDEPFSSLDAALRDGTRRAVTGALAAAGVTTVLVTHDQSEALSLADQVAVMRHGRLTQTASPAELYSAPVDIDTATFVGAAVILAAHIHNGTAACVLGALPVRPGAPDGPAQVLIRPEQIIISAPESGGVAATVTETTYYGHDAIVRLELASGDAITARTPGYAAPRVGETVSLTVNGNLHVFLSTQRVGQPIVGAD